MRTLGEFPRILKSAAFLREPHRVCRYLEDLAGDYHRFYDSCRVLPQGDEEPGTCTPRGLRCAGHPAGHRERSADPRRQLSGADVNAHPAGPRHAEEIHHGGAPARPTADEMLTLAPNVWPRNTVRVRTARCRSPGCPWHARRRVRHAAVRHRRGRLPFPLPRHRRGVRRRRARPLRRQGIPLHRDRALGRRGRPVLDVASGGELAVALNADFPPIESRCTATTNRSPSSPWPSKLGSTTSCWTR